MYFTLSGSSSRVTDAEFKQFRVFIDEDINDGPLC